MSPSGVFVDIGRAELVAHRAGRRARGELRGKRLVIATARPPAATAGWRQTRRPTAAEVDAWMAVGRP